MTIRLSRLSAAVSRAVGLSRAEIDDANRCQTSCVPQHHELPIISRCDGLYDVAHRGSAEVIGTRGEELMGHVLASGEHVSIVSNCELRRVIKVPSTSHATG